MGNGMCSRKQKRIFQALAFLVVVVGFIYGGMLNYDLQKQLKKVEAVAVKYQQHQESLSAQLQVVYEHRSRLEKSLQKERLEHKKAKEDYLVYKLEAQETLNKGRQDSNSRYNALSVQHQMLKSQHEDLRKQHTDLQAEHQKLSEDLTRTFSDHKEKYVQLQQEKEQELSKMKENVYNLREENKQLRKAHQDVHIQLQDVKQQHKNLLSQHEQVVLNLDSHKSALAAAQSQVEEFIQLKEALNKMSSLRQNEKNTTMTEHGSPPTETAHKQSVQLNAKGVNNELEQTNVQTHEEDQNPDIRISNEEVIVPTRVSEKSVENMRPEKEAEPPTEHAVELEEEHKKEMEEEEMEQVGKPERLVEDQDQIQEEPEQRHSEEEQRVDGNEEEQREEETNMMQEHNHAAAISQTMKPQNKFKSAYEEQLEQQQLAAQHEERARQLRQQQESLHQHRLQEHMLRQQKMREQDLELQRQNTFKEQLVEKIRKQAQYDNMDQDIVQGEEGQHLQEEGGAYDRDNHQDEAEDVDLAANDGNEEQGLAQQAHSREQQGKAPAEDVNPADDPNNQGEDEFEEAEQEREENLPDENEQHRLQHQGQPEGQEHLVMAGNPDQQEDNIDEQYQEELEEEVQEDLTEERKREQNGEEPYGEHDENIVHKHIGAEREQEAPHGEHRERNEDEYEEEGEEEEDGGKNNQRAEM
ncbi:Hypothetical predicted protein [Pelobates cultripes]|uniref:Golgi integral membrane protein 4 n=1 Tax=Pelobates cultripes TaxID=61616 RepID=A0AAD1RBQ3_PELCU|nr:Hypothetical predicted protein [Pelobates cultripes]